MIATERGLPKTSSRFWILQSMIKSVGCLDWMASSFGLSPLLSRDRLVRSGASRLMSIRSSKDRRQPSACRGLDLGNPEAVPVKWGTVRQRPKSVWRSARPCLGSRPGNEVGLPRRLLPQKRNPCAVHKLARSMNCDSKQTGRILGKATSILFATLAFVGCASTGPATPPQDAAEIEAILEDVRMGWEQGDGAPFYLHFLDWEGARYFEGGGQNLGLRDLVEHHVEPEADLGLSLAFSNIQTHFEGGFAWALVDTQIHLTTSDGREINNRGHGSYLFRWVGDAWKVVHTQSASSPIRD